MLQRDISLMEVAEIILYGDIVEGFDVAKYPVIAIQILFVQSLVKHPQGEF